MKFVVIVKNKGEEETWEEKYDEPEVTTHAEAEEWSREVIDIFNFTLRPYEKEREFVAARLVEETENEREDVI